MDNYDIPVEYINFANDVRERLNDVDGNAALYGLLDFLNLHGRRTLERMTLDIWVGQRDNPDREEAKMIVQNDVAIDLQNIIDQIRDDGNDVTARSITDRLVGRFGIRARGRKKPKKHTRRRRSRHRRSRHNKRKHKKSKQR